MTAHLFAPFRLLFVFALLALLVASCAEDETPPLAGGDGTDSVVSFADDVLPILTTSCNSAGCHSGTGQAGLSLESSVAYDKLVDVNSTQVPSLKLVAPGDADNSYLIHKLEDNQSVGSRMPTSPRPALSSDEIERIRAWIDDGAEDN